ncbi:hypothetical protein [Rhodoferax sp. GW822-FHT02A01]|uniref:hypothetical protein n=1 Tax=Rhodoferax sp. GW822-FHT02A01 TaxID=3141537 RepID=UPI00315C58A3
MVETILGTVLAICSLFLAFEKPRKMVISAYEFCRNNPNKLIKYNDTLTSKGFLKWQINALLSIYSSKVVAFNNGRHFPVAIFEFDDSQALCGDVNDKFQYLGKLSDESITSHNPKTTATQREYWNLINRTIHSKDQLGFYLKKLSLNSEGKMIGFDAGICKYQDTVITNNFLLYEQYKAYISGDTLNTGNWRLKLPQLANVIGLNSLIGICKPSNCFPLLSVQAIIVYKDYISSGCPWRFRFMVRSKSGAVSSYAGYKQITPSGGFEFFGDSNNASFEEVKKHFNIVNAIYRETLEELFGHEEFQYGKNRIDKDDLQRQTEIQDLQASYSSAQSDISSNRNSGHGIHFLGTAVTLSAVRHHLSFLIIVDSPNYAKRSVTVGIESHSLESANIADLDNEFLLSDLVTPDSVGLVLLLKKSGLLEKYGIH